MTQPSFGYMRVSDAERERAVDVLKAGFTEGRLTQDEYADRVSSVHAAQTYNDLAELTYDLPIGPFGTLAPPPPPGLRLGAPPAGADPGYSSAPSLQAYPGYLPGAPYALPGAPYALPGAPYALPGAPYAPPAMPYAPPAMPYAPRLPGYEPAGFFPPGLPPVEPQRDALAVASLGLALATLAFPPAPFAAVGLGIAALVRIRRTGQRGRNFAVAGIALGTLGILFLVAFILPALTTG